MPIVSAATKYVAENIFHVFGVGFEFWVQKQERNHRHLYRIRPKKVRKFAHFCMHLVISHIRNPQILAQNRTWYLNFQTMTLSRAKIYEKSLLFNMIPNI